MVLAIALAARCAERFLVGDASVTPGRDDRDTMIKPPPGRWAGPTCWARAVYNSPPGEGRQAAPAFRR
jgi:hypothetical protein